MHESKIAEYVLEILTETADSDDDLRGKDVKKITFSQGNPPFVVPDSFEFYFTELIRGTQFENAVFEYLTDEGDLSGGFYIQSIETMED